MLSNHYFVFAKKFGMETPKHYKLGYHYDVPKTIGRNVADLRRTLPEIVDRVTPEILLELEGGNYGSRQVAMNTWGPDYLEHVKISDYPDT